MKIENLIKTDLRKSMIGKDKERTSLLRTLLGEFNRVGKDLSDNKALSIIKKMKENAVLLKNDYEISVLSEYLPKVFNEIETNKIIDDFFNGQKFSKKDFGLIMKKLKDKYGQSIDMKIVSKIVKTKI